MTKKLDNVPPGEILREEFLKPMEISAYRLAKETFILQTRINLILIGRRRITADTALRLSKFFGTTAKFWLELQADYDIEEEYRTKWAGARMNNEIRIITSDIISFCCKHGAPHLDDVRYPELAKDGVT